MSSIAVVLAAGAGQRFAGDQHKLRASFRGRPLVEWAVDAARRSGLDTIVVTGAVDLADVLDPEVVVVPNPGWSSGQASSLDVARSWALSHGHDAMVVGLGDQPLVTTEAWSAVAASDGSIAVATYRGRRRNPVRLARDVWPLLPATGDEGARALMRRRPDLVVEVACSGEPADVDTVEDLRRWS
ncbi:MAG: nucleotidyltransferase family protein [Acidimicrobiales bacterium]